MKHKYKYLIVLIFVSYFSLGIGFNKKIDTESKIYKNIFIEDIDISHLTFNEALNKVKLNYREKSIKLNYDNKIYIINPNDIKLNFNIENAVEEAYYFTRTDDTLLNIKRKLNLKFKDKHKIKLVSCYDETKLSKIINNICNEIDIKEINAKINIKNNGSIERTKSKYGKKVDKVKLKENIYNMISSKKIKDIKIPVNKIKPKICTEDVNSINTILGQFSTSFNEHSPRGHNINTAATSTSDTFLMPNKIFSYNNLTGERNWHNGYKQAKVIIGGKYVNGEGGGVCQVSTTIYNAALLSGLKILEVHNHTLPSKYAPIGRDAAVSYGYTDFKFENSFSHPIYIKNTVQSGVLTSKIYGNISDKRNIYIKTQNKYEKEKIQVKTYRLYINEKGEIIKKECINKCLYKNK